MSDLVGGYGGGIINLQKFKFSVLQLLRLGKDHAAALTTTFISGLTTTQIGALTTTQVSALTSTQLGSLTTTALSGMSTTQIGALAPALIGGLTTTHINTMTTTQIGTLTSLGVSYLTTTQIGLLTTTQLTAMNAGLLPALTTTQIASLTTTQLTALNAGLLPALTTTQIGQLTTTQLSGLSSTQIAALGGVAGYTEGRVVFAGSDGKPNSSENFGFDADTNQLSLTGLLAVTKPTTAASDKTNLANAVTFTNGLGGGNNPSLAGLTNGDLGPSNYVFTPGTVGLLLSSSITLVTIKFYNLAYSGNGPAANFSVETTANGGSTWNAATPVSIVGGVVNGSGFTADDASGWVEATVSPVFGNGMRISISSSHHGLWSMISEMKIFGTTGSNQLMSVGEAGAGFGTSSPTAMVDAYNTSDSLALRALRSGTVTTDPIAQFASDVTTTNSVKCQINNNGDLKNTNNSYGALSGRRFKENITDATPKLPGLLDTRIVNFNLIGDTLRQIGVIAEELELIFPGLVETSPDYEMLPDPNWIPHAGQAEKDRPLVKHDLGTVTKSVKYSVFVPILIKAMQEMHAIFEEQKAEQAAALNAMSERVEVLEGGA
ncbi:MAG: tail fiber domain-containing protein [Magnetococcales bacterium]|nr:tail fiber domain-containing protein [Magnetococcales bacterium]